MFIKLVVTPDNIEQGIEEDCEKGPVGRAIHELFPDAIDIDVASDYMTLRDAEGELWGAIPSASCSLFISDFDMGKPVIPTIFFLDFHRNQDGE